MASDVHPDTAEPDNAGPDNAGQGSADQGAGEGAVQPSGEAASAVSEPPAEPAAPIVGLGDPDDPPMAPMVSLTDSEPPASARPMAPMVSLGDIADEGDASIIDRLMAACTIADDERALVEAGLRAYLSYVLRSNSDIADVAGVDLLIAEINAKMAAQLDEVLHHPRFQELESAWRSLKFLIDRVDFRENISVQFLNVSKRDLFEDFQDSPEIPASGLFRVAYSAEYGVFGGRPYGLIIANYEFSPTPQDISLLSDCASVATMAHAPFVAAASPRFFGLDNWHTLPQLAELEALFSGPQYTKWQAFRDSNDSRYVALCLPRFLLRLPYDNSANRVRAFEYEEHVVGHHERYLWGNAAFAFATRVGEAFANYRWCVNIVGPTTGGTVDDLPLHAYEAMGEIQKKIPTEIMITERREYEIASAGFMPFTYRPETNSACFFSVNSVQKPRTFGISKDGREEELNYRLGTQINYLLISCRLAHYIKVIQRENIGSWKEQQDLERELQRWLQQYVASQNVATASVRARRPLRNAKVSVTEVAGNAGWYKIDLKVQPHFKYLGSVFQLGIVGRLDQE